MLVQSVYLSVFVSHASLCADTYQSSHCIENINEQESEYNRKHIVCDGLNPKSLVILVIGFSNYQKVHLAPIVGMTWKPFPTKLALSSTSVPRLRLTLSQPFMFLRFTQS